MNITNIKIRKIFDQEILKAIVSITIDDEFAVHDIRIIRGEAGRLFAAMPSRRDDIGIHRDIVHPIDSEARKSMETQILSAYHEYLGSEIRAC
ncbi:MAG: SpoVG family protein [Oscillospiraceae bacterium]|nr:SpoVG family protein [Oscillospiraceae bacterium]